MSAPSQDVLLDSNAYFRLGNSIRPLLQRTFGPPPPYSLHVLAELDDEYASNFRLRHKFEWFRDYFGVGCPISQHTTRKPEKIEVRDLGFRWGSCGKGGVVYFNWKALQLPVRLVDDIIVHELVHLVEGHHGPEFWQALGRAMPDWQKRKDALADKAKDYLVFGLPSGRAASRLGAASEK